MKKGDIDRRKGSSEDIAIFAPIEEIRNIEQVIRDLEIALKELQKVTRQLSPVTCH